MSWHPFLPSIKLHVAGRISGDDACRQERTAREILRRLADRPGLVLADEVGMGKTFVALAVATSVALSDRERRPVVVMVPPSLREKWPRDFAVFAEKCLPKQLAREVRSASAESAIEFLKLLDDEEPERRKAIIFLTHGAMHRGLGQGITSAWVKLAIIQRALRGRHHTQAVRRSLDQCLGKLLRVQWVEKRAADGLWARLLDARPASWLRLLRREGIDPEGDSNSETDDNPVPQAVVEVLRSFDTSKVYETLRGIPQRRTPTYETRVREAGLALTDELKVVWARCLTQLRIRLPLLVLDEAHHLKNEKTRLASLFQNPEAVADAEEVTRGALGGVFERMLFLTATPFQLGHQELCSVLDRFEAIAWDSRSGPGRGRDEFRTAVRDLRKRLDAAQASAQGLDSAWGQLRVGDLCADDRKFSVREVADWWRTLPDAAGLTPTAQRVQARYSQAFQKMRYAEEALQPWVIRHLKSRTFGGQPRRQRLPGKAIISDTCEPGEAGIEVSGEALLPFLLAARATACAPDTRPLFAEGLASSYEAFKDTRKARQESTDGDDDDVPIGETDDAVARWYLDRLQDALPLEDHKASAAHPKIAATARRVLGAWRQGEKVLVFCHFVQTGRVLRRVISGLMLDEILNTGAKKLACPPAKVLDELERVGKRFFDTDSPVREACDAGVEALLANYDRLQQHRDALREMTRRYLRTPSFLVRFFALRAGGLTGEAVRKAFSAGDSSDLSLMLSGFFGFLQNQCVQEELSRYMDAISKVQTGSLAAHEVEATLSADERQQEAFNRILPNVRLVNGAVKSETRQRLMLTFNSPFFPEVLIASSVMAEGVDLHRCCRYVIHHDLCWNPSTLEQRTGRVDRIGAKVESCGKPIRVYLPYLSETQDEKQYRVVMDRERWFSVVMGECFKVDGRTTERLAQRVPLPDSVAEALTLRLSIDQTKPPD